MNLTPSTYEQALAYLTINGSFTGDLGLFHGRMGIILFFAHYARATQSKHYEDFAGYLLDELYEEIHEDLPVNLENGLCGIGWGIEYLVQQGFMEGDTDEILADIDRKVMELDPARMTKLDFRRGLAGIAFYVIARLNANRTTAALPFDDAYLTSLQQALERAEFTEKEEVPADLPVVFNQVLKGEKLTLSLPDCLTRSSLSLDKSFDEILLGLEEGLAGWLWSNLDPAVVRMDLLPKTEKYIILIDTGNKSSNYGIGTYILSLKKALQISKWRIIHIRLFSTLTNSYLFERTKSSICVNITGFRNLNCNSKNILRKYYKNIFFVIYNCLSTIQYSIFHLNVMQGEELAQLLKKYFPKSPLVLSVHYTNWSFYLSGDKRKLKDILKHKKENQEHLVYKSFMSEKNIMQQCDKIIAIAQHSYNDILNLYQIPKEKVLLIPHGLQDAYKQLSKNEKIERREKYGFSPNEQLLLFAGRIDPIKGIEYLIKAFTLLAFQYPKLRLIIAGDGDFNNIFAKLCPVWSKVTCTGFVEKSVLYELYSICDIGIVPSVHEEFGYVALEMMMMGLPIIVGKTTGLSELVKNNNTGIVIPTNNSERLAHSIATILDNEYLKYKISSNERKHFQEKYSFPFFQKKMLKFYSTLPNHLSNK